MKTNPKHLEGAIAKIKERYGSVVNYCKTVLGITDQEILSMREKYLEY